jgi:hypothetical protein
MLRGSSLALSLLIATAGCTAQGVRTAGYATAATGGLLVAGGILVATGCTESSEPTNEYGEDPVRCTSDETLSPEASAFAVGGGLALIVVGLMIATAPGAGKAKTSTPPPYGNGNLY